MRSHDGYLIYCCMCHHLLYLSGKIHLSLERLQVSTWRLEIWSSQLSDSKDFLTRSHHLITDEQALRLIRFLNCLPESPSQTPSQEQSQQQSHPVSENL